MQKELDMSNYKPFKDYSGLCKFKSFKERKMLLPTVEKYVLDGEYLFRPAREHEIDEVVEIYREGIPRFIWEYKHNEVVLWPNTLVDYLQIENGFMKGDRLLIVGEKLDEKKLTGANDN